MGPPGCGYRPYDSWLGARPPGAQAPGAWAYREVFGRKAPIPAGIWQACGLERLALHNICTDDDRFFIFFHAKQKLLGHTFFGTDFNFIWLKLINNKCFFFFWRHSSSAVKYIWDGVRCAPKYTDTVPWNTLRSGMTENQASVWHD